MYKKFLSIFILALCMVSFFNVGYAANFMSLGTYKLSQLYDNDTWERTYKTGDGTFKLKIRKMPNANAREKYHFLVWLNDQKITDGYFSDTNDYYEVQMFKEKNTDRLFVAIQSGAVSKLLGYDPSNNKFKGYVISSQFYSLGDATDPKFSVDDTGDLQLYFTSTGDQYASRYKLRLNGARNVFTYEDVTIAPPPPPPPPPVYTPRTTYTPPASQTYYPPAEEDVVTDEEEWVTGS